MAEPQATVPPQLTVRVLCDRDHLLTGLFIVFRLKPRTDGQRWADVARVRLQSLCSWYGWSLWGFIQAAASPLDFDFWSWGLERYDKARAAFADPGFPRLLEETARG